MLLQAWSELGRSLGVIVFEPDWRRTGFPCCGSGEPITAGTEGVEYESREYDV